MPDSESNQDTPELFPKTVGEMLRDARVARNMDLAEVAARTRIPLRHLEAIERSDYSTLPSKTYGIGFVKAYARAVGADEVAIARALREETDRAFKPTEPRPEPVVIQHTRRAPTGGLAAVVLITLLIAAAAAALYFGSSLFRGAESPPDSASSTANELGMVNTAAPAPAPTPSATPTGGQVTLTANDQVWVRIYDATGKTLMEKTMAAGERYDVPLDANNPMINIGRPNQLSITINGSPVAPLGGPEHAIKDVGVSAAALLARGQPTPVPTPSATAISGTPVPTPTATQRAPQPRTVPTPRSSVHAPIQLLPTPKPYVPSPVASVAAPPPAPVATPAP